MLILQEWMHAKGLRVAYKLIEDGVLNDFIAKRYESFTEGIGKDIVEGKVGFKELETYAMKNEFITNKSGRQEMLEAIINQYLMAE